jgi:hypothetical protein
MHVESVLFVGTLLRRAYCTPQPEVYILVYIYIYMYVYIYVYVYITIFLLANKYSPSFVQCA